MSYTTWHSAMFFPSKDVNYLVRNFYKGKCEPGSFKWNKKGSQGGETEILGWLEQEQVLSTSLRYAVSLTRQDFSTSQQQGTVILSSFCRTASYGSGSYSSYLCSKEQELVYKEQPQNSPLETCNQNKKIEFLFSYFRNASPIEQNDRGTPQCIISISIGLCEGYCLWRQTSAFYKYGSGQDLSVMIHWYFELCYWKSGVGRG